VKGGVIRKMGEDKFYILSPAKIIYDLKSAYKIKARLITWLLFYNYSIKV
jgi:hypothetical protein